MTKCAIGIDLGGTKISGIVLGPENDVLWKGRVATPSGDYPSTLLAIEGLVRTALENCVGETPAAVGIGIPGELSSDGQTVKNANSTCLIGQALKTDLQVRLGLSVKIANDANCFALSEARDGAGAGHDVVFGVIIGTGTGGGIVLNGQIHAGRNRLAGEWGHNPFPLLGEGPKNRPCYCGRVDCNETWLSGPALALDYRDLTGQHLSAVEISARAEAGEAAARKVMAGYATHLAKGLSSVVNLLDPDVIVLGGGLSNVAFLYDAVPGLISDYIFNATDRPADFQTPVLANKWGDDSGVRGAAWLAREA